MKHIIDLSDFSNDEIDNILKISNEMMLDPEKFSKVLDGKILATLFFEPSTRTNFSFQSAMIRLGGSVIGFSDANSSSTSKGESLKDTIKTISSYADVIVMRNPFEGSAFAGSLFSDVPLINAGDGGHLHPTQTLTDLVTIDKYLGRLDNFTIGLCGDLKFGRTVHSLIKSLSKRKNVKFVLISPKELEVPEYIYDFMAQNDVEFEKTSKLEAQMQNLDVLYMTRVQRERFDDESVYDELKNVYILDKDKLGNAKDSLCILHPLPRVDEIADEVDDDPRALYFKQVKCGMYARMALFYYVMQGEFDTVQGEKDVFDVRCLNPKCISNQETYLQHFSSTECCYCDKKLENKI